MTTTYNSFQSPASGTGLTAASGSNADGSTAWTSITLGASGTLTTATTHPAHGTQGLAIVTAGSAATYAVWSAVGALNTAATTIWIRVYCYLTANPAGAWKVFQLLNSVNGIFTQVVVSTGGLVIQQNPAGTNVSTSVATVPLNTPFRIEQKTVLGASTGVWECGFYNGDSTTPIEAPITLTAQAVGTGTITQARIGQTAANNVTTWIDDVAVSDTSYPGPVYPVRRSIGKRSFGF